MGEENQGVKTHGLAVGLDDALHNQVVLDGGSKHLGLGVVRPLIYQSSFLRISSQKTRVGSETGDWKKNGKLALKIANTEE